MEGNWWLSGVHLIAGVQPEFLLIGRKHEWKYHMNVGVIVVKIDIKSFI